MTEEEFDAEMAYAVWLIEKIFHFPITDDFPLLKFNNLKDGEHFKRYNKENTRMAEEIRTFGR